MDYSFVGIIKQVNALDSSSLTDEVKLRRSSELFYRGSLDILTQVEAALEKVRQQEVDLADTLVDDSFSQFLASLTQQSISTLFWQQYLQPQVRAKYKRESTVRVESLTPVEAVSEFDLDLLESKVISLAHDEDIDEWIDIIKHYLHQLKRNRVSLVNIVRDTKLNVAKVFLGLLHGEFVIVQTNFYDLASLLVILD